MSAMRAQYAHRGSTRDAEMGNLRGVRQALQRVGFALFERFMFAMAYISAFFAFEVCNELDVQGTENIPRIRRGVLYFEVNHTGMNDSFVMTRSMLNRLWWNLPAVPYNLPELSNFYNTPLMRLIMDAVHNIPVPRKDPMGALRICIRKLRELNIRIFPQGGRQIPGTLRGVERGAGVLIESRHVILVVPVFLDSAGVQHYRKNPGDPPKTWWRYVLGKGGEWIFSFRWGRRIGIGRFGFGKTRRLRVFYGKPIKPWKVRQRAAEMIAQGDTRKSSQIISNLLFEHTLALEGNPDKAFE